MKNKIIRLTESDIHQIIKESVNRIITELDWRTYANAAKKRDAQIKNSGRDATDKGGNRLSHLRNQLDYAASDALTSKYSQKHNNGYPTNNADIYTNNGNQSITTYNFDGKGRGSKGEFNYDKKGGINKQGNNIVSKMDNEVEDYMNGKSKYVKGKGWQNENKVIRESRMYDPNAVYIVFDGTSHYALYGCDVEDEINDNGVEVVKGPFSEWNDYVDSIVEKLNNEAYGNY